MQYAITDETWAVLGPMIERCKSPFGPEPGLMPMAQRALAAARCGTQS